MNIYSSYTNGGEKTQSNAIECEKNQYTKMIGEWRMELLIYYTYKLDSNIMVASWCVQFAIAP